MTYYPINGRVYHHVTVLKFCGLPCCSASCGFVSDSWATCKILGLMCFEARHLKFGVQCRLIIMLHTSSRMIDYLNMVCSLFLWSLYILVNTIILEIVQDRHGNDGRLIENHVPIEWHQYKWPLVTVKVTRSLKPLWLPDLRKWYVYTEIRKCGMRF